MNYARLWLSFLKPKSPQVDEERRHYAEAVGNIEPEMYPIFEAAITGRPGIAEGDFDPNTGGLKGTLEGSLVGLATQTPEEAQRLRNAFAQEGMIESIFELLRRVPRRLLMVLKIKLVAMSTCTCHNRLGLTIHFYLSPPVISHDLWTKLSIHLIHLGESG